MAHDNLPYARTTADEDEAKQTFEEFKRAADGMRTTGQLITEKLSANGRMTEANKYKEKVHKTLQIVAEFRRIYGDILSFTSSWHPGHGSQIDGTELYRAPSERGSHRSHRSSTSESKKEEEVRLQTELAQAKANQEALDKEEAIERQKLELAHIEEKQKLEMNNRRKRLNQEAERKLLEVRLQTVREEPEEDKARSESDDNFVDAFIATERSKLDSVSRHKEHHQTTVPVNSLP